MKKRKNTSSRDRQVKTGFKRFTRKWALLFLTVVIIFSAALICSSLLPKDKLIKVFTVEAVLVLLIFPTLYFYAFKKSRKIMCLIISMLIMVLCGLGIYYTASTMNFISSITGAKGADSVNVTKESFNVLITGIDTEGPIDEKSRSDVNMIATVNPVSKQILLTSLPRDYYVCIDGKPGHEDKLTHSGLYGAMCTAETVESFMDIDINYYVKVNYSTVISLVDALGGIDVDSDYDFYFTPDTSYHFNKGPNHLNGDSTLKFARERHSFPDGDLQRNRDQQKVLKAIIEKLTSNRRMVTKYSGLLNSLDGKIEMNLSRKEINSLIRMQLVEMPKWKIEQQSITGDLDMKPCMSMGGAIASVVIKDEKSIDKAVLNIEKMENVEN